MNKDDILARSRAENQGSDEYEKQVLEKAGKLSAQVGIMVCCFIAIASGTVTGQINYGCWVIYFAIQASLFWTKWRYMKKRHEGIMAAAAAAAGLMFLGLFIWELVRGTHG
ncbi:MAG: hypothetical protein K2O45_11825 [Oscillospiraceae bacterium]|nr:hypothetical protein [Oscillospiraceae bacterium]